MNEWLKLSLYALLGIILASLILGTLAPNNGINFSVNLNRPGTFFEGGYYNRTGGWNMMQYGASHMQYGMPSDRGHAQNNGY